jgi:transposase
MSGHDGLPAIPAELEAEMAPAVRAFVVQLLARIADLESRLRRTPQNSSLPPSTQHPHAKPAVEKSKSKKQRGGQPGHKKHERPLLPTDACDEVQRRKPTECRRCGSRLSGCDPAPLRHQVWELPEIKPHVTEYQRHRLACRQCGETTCAALPPGVPQSQAGPRLVALTALLMGCFKQSKRRVALFLEQVLNQPCSPGWVVKLQDQATAALTPPYEELTRQLPTEAVLGIDESPTKEAKLKSWLWTFVEVEGVEPTNNVSERALRPAVIWRKLSFGTQIAAGSRFVETILTVVETCHQQSRNSFEYLTAALQAHFAGQPPPSLINGV